MKDDTEPKSEPTAPTECDGQPLLFPDFGPRPVVVDFNGGDVSSDGGSVLLGQTDRSRGHLRRFAECFTDHRDPDSIEHSLEELLRQRVYGLALGYEDLNDHDRLAHDPLLASVCGKVDPTGENRQRKTDKGKALAGKSTLNRLELTPEGATGDSRYKKITANHESIEAYFIDEFVRSLAKGTTEVVLDIDATHDPVHGEQEGRFFNGFYQQYCYLPLYIFAGHWPVLAWLRSSEHQASHGALEKVQRIVKALRHRFPKIRICLRADSGFCRDDIMTWCEENAVQYVFGLARNKVLQRILRGAMRTAKSMQEFNKSEAERVFKDFGYRAKSWSESKRRVVGKAEHTRLGANPRFIISNIPASEIPARELYEIQYCGRGEMENRIKEQHLDLHADRTSAHTLRANQLRLWFSTLAYLLVNQLRQIGLAGTELAKATCGTIRLRLLKIGALVRVSVRRVVASMSSAFPLRSLFTLAMQRMCQQPSS